MQTVLGPQDGHWGGWILVGTGSYAMALWVALVMAVVSPTLLWMVAPRHPNPPAGRQLSGIGLHR